jgi:phytoene dehydrogenase-like protein
VTTAPVPGASHDAIVVGAGPNGLVAANVLADHGWSVLLLEAQESVGGAVRTDEEVHPGFRHDTFSSFYPFAVASPAIRALHLEEHGLRWRHAPAVLGHPLPGGEWALLSRDRELTASIMELQHPGDGAAWLALCEQWDRIGDRFVQALTKPFPPVRAGLGLAARMPGAGGLDLVKQLLMPALNLGDHRFGGVSPKILLAGNAGHSDIPPTAPGSGAYGLLMTMLGQTVGFPVPEGGAGELSEALARRFRARGGEIRCGAEVVRIEVEGRRARAVRTGAGERYAARRAVLADVTAPLLYGRLLQPDDVPRSVLRAMREFQLDPSTVKIDWALDGPVPWASEPTAAPGTVHVADSLEEMAVAQTQVAAHAIPARPFLLAGQMTTADPSRSPEGTESMWAYTHVPQRTDHDAGGAGIRGVWDRDDCERFADRVQGRLEELAPGFGSQVLARRVLGPRQLEERDASLVGGAINGGTSQLHQEAVLRPVPGLGRAGTRIGGLFLASSSAHPGGGVHGAPGGNAARAALAWHRRLRTSRS